MKFFSRSLWQRLLAVAVALFVILVVYKILISPIFSFWENQRREIETLSAKHTRYMDLLASKDNIHRQSQLLVAQLFETGILREGTAPAVVAADIQSQIGKIISDIGGTILSTSDLPVIQKETMTYVGLHVNFEGNLSAVVKLLESCETSKPFIFVDNLTIRRPDMTQPNEKTPELSVGLDIYNYLLRDEQ